MSPGSSDPLFDSADFNASSDAFEGAEPIALPGPTSEALPATRISAVQQVHGFTIYTILLYSSFLMLAVASILFFMDAGKY